MNLQTEKYNVRQVVRFIPQCIGYAERVRIGRCCDYVRITIFGVNCGIWGWK